MYKKIRMYLLACLIVGLCLLSYFFLQAMASGLDEFIYSANTCANQASTTTLPEKIAELNKMPFITFKDLPTSVSASSEASSISTDTGCILKTKYYGNDKRTPEIMLMVYPIKSSNNTVATFHEHWNCYNYDTLHAANVGFQSICTTDLFTLEGNFGVDLITIYASTETDRLTDKITIRLSSPT